METARSAQRFWPRYLSVHADAGPARANLLLTYLYLRQQGEDVGLDYDGFRALFDEHIGRIDPADAALPWDRLGHWAQDEDDWVEAARCFQQAYDLAGGHYGYCLGTALNFLGRHGEALPLVQAQADGPQPDAMSWLQVAIAHEHLGRPEAAVEAYQTALALDPDYALAMFNMGGVLWNSGEHDRGDRHAHSRGAVPRP